MTPYARYCDVSTINTEPADLMILRAWIEPVHKPPLRVRIIQLGGGDGGLPITSAAATIDDVCSAVRTWLDQLLTRDKPGPQPPGCG